MLRSIFSKLSFVKTLNFDGRKKPGYRIRSFAARIATMSRMKWVSLVVLTLAAAGWRTRAGACRSHGHAEEVEFQRKRSR